MGLRHMQTLGERRAAYQAVEDAEACCELGVCLKLRRVGRHSLPSDFDDVRREAHKNWKKYRKRQWRASR